MISIWIMQMETRHGGTEINQYWTTLGNYWSENSDLLWAFFPTLLKNFQRNQRTFWKKKIMSNKCPHSSSKKTFSIFYVYYMFLVLYSCCLPLLKWSNRLFKEWMGQHDDIDIKSWVSVEAGDKIQSSANRLNFALYHFSPNIIIYYTLSIQSVFLGPFLTMYK